MAHDDPEEGELSDEGKPSSSRKGRGKVASDASDSPPAGFSKIPLPFKPRVKNDPGPSNPGRSTGRRIYERAGPPDPYAPPTNSHYDRYQPDERDRPVTDWRNGPSGYGDPGYRDHRHDYHAPYDRLDTYRPDYASDYHDYDDRGRGPSYYPGPDDYDSRSRRGGRGGDDFRPRSPDSNPHRLPKRPSPPPFRRGSDHYRPRSPEFTRGPTSDYADSYLTRRPLDLPPRPPSPTDPLRRPPSPQRPTEFLPQTDGKLKLSVKRNASGANPEPKPPLPSSFENPLQPPQREPPPPSEPPPPPPAGEPEGFVNGAPPPPTDEPPPIPPPLIPRPPGQNGNYPEPSSQDEPLSSSQPTSAPSKSGGVPLIKATGTKTMRSTEAEAEAYGRTFAGVDRLADFELLNKLGEGTFGEVHKARHKTTGQMVALKRIIMKNETEGVPITALREIRILKQLDHPSIVSLVTMIVQRQQRAAETSLYMVLPYMEHDLAGLLENPSVKLSISQIKLYMLQLCEGVGYLHRNKILHRDLKSANLLINNSGGLQIADFGLARPVEFISTSCDSPEHYSRERRSYTQSVVTRWYRSPELLLGARKYEGWVDMWGVGCIFAEMFQRRPVLPGTSDTDQLTKIFQLCGSPNEDNFPDWSRQDPKNEYVAHWAPMPRRIQSVLPQDASPETLDFLDRLLTLDPYRRMTAFESLDHDYFWTEPMPADPASLPRYDDSHEFNRRRFLQNAPQHNGVPLPISQQPPGPGPIFFPQQSGFGGPGPGGPGPGGPMFFPPQNGGGGGYPSFQPPPSNMNGNGWGQHPNHNNFHRGGPGPGQNNSSLPPRPFLPSRPPPFVGNGPMNGPPPPQQNGLPPPPIHPPHMQQQQQPPRATVLPTLHFTPGQGPPPMQMYGGPPNGGGYGGPPPPMGNGHGLPPNPNLPYPPPPASASAWQPGPGSRRAREQGGRPSGPTGDGGGGGLNYG